MFNPTPSEEGVERRDSDPFTIAALRFTDAVFAEAVRAKRLFPSNWAVMCALTEEVGETAKALMEEPWENVYKEAVQTAAMALRLAIEGDPSMDSVRRERVKKKD